MTRTAIEQAAYQTIESAFRGTFDHVSLHTNIMVSCPSADEATKVLLLDCVVVCDAGVFLFDIQTWGSHIFVERVELPGLEKKQWIVRASEGPTESVADPVAHGVEKAMQLRKLLPLNVHCQHYVVATGENVEFSGRLPASIVTTSDLPYLSRIIRSQGKRSKKTITLSLERWQATSNLIASLQSHSSVEFAAKQVCSDPTGQHVEGQVQVSNDRATVWVHALDGSTIGRFSKRFGMDIHTPVSSQLAGAAQCLYCTHEPAGKLEWHSFIRLMAQHYEICVPEELIAFDLP